MALANVWSEYVAEAQTADLMQPGERATPKLERPEWMSWAACRGAPPEAFFPARGEPLTVARALCADCPVLEPCATYAMADPELAGVWAGTSVRQRRKLRAANPKPRAPATVCSKGHALDGTNTFLRSDGSRGCRTCRRAAEVRARWKAKQRSEKVAPVPEKAKPAKAKPKWCATCGVCPVLAKGRCRSCYAFWKRTGHERPDAEERAVAANRRAVERRYELDVWGPGGAPEPGAA